jgi:pimeloyl-ACP methyl ester carboxylesterase
MTVIQSTRLNRSRERVPLQPGDSSTWLELVAELAPRADIAIVPGVGHFTMIEAADAVNRHIETMLTTIAGR